MNTAILFDTLSIQNYVFGSNKLKENLGASFLVENVYKVLITKEKEQKLKVGYIGGGNALVFIDSEGSAKELVKEFTTTLLYESPGLSVSVAIDPDFSRADPFSDKLGKLFTDLAVNKGRFFPVDSIPTHGITAVCPHTGYSVEGMIRYENTTTLLSSMALSKLSASKEANKEVETLSELAGIAQEFSFTDQLDRLGQRKNEDSHIAVVHIDGNGFGEEFRKLQDLDSIKLLSSAVKNAVQESFGYILKLIAIHSKELSESIEFVKDTDGRRVLPIRPIVLGGDDITFVCHGKLGIWLAEHFMYKFQEYRLPDGIPYSSCAGIAIVKTKYPFYRAYQLAEELCTNAKKKRKDSGNKRGEGNWIDFHLAYGGLGNSLEEIRILQYQNSNNKPIYSRPFSLAPTGMTNSIETLKKQAVLLRRSLPNTKIKDLREILTHDQASKEVFIEHLIHQHEDFRLKFCEHRSATSKLENYPFFDMIELLELYPTNLLNVIQDATTEL